MNLIIAAIVLAIIAAVIDHLWGIGEPWKKIIYAGVVIIFVIGLVLLLVPGLLPLRI
jgi:hypothetical protein